MGKTLIAMHSGGYIIYEHTCHEHFKNSPIIVVNNLKMEAKYGSNKPGRVHYAISVKCTSLYIYRVRSTFSI